MLVCNNTIFKVRLYNNIYSIMKRIESIDELKRIQLEILLSFHKFCTDNEIVYSLAAGTLIGAVRHKGFIPWDDDIDIYLTRVEYNKLISVYPQIYDNKYRLITIERDKDWHRASGKLVDNRTIEIEATRNNYTGIGIGIDIFPIDDVPDNYDEWIRYEKKRRFLRNVVGVKSLLYSSKRPLHKNLFMFMCRLALYPFSFKYLSNLQDKYAQLHNGKGYSHVYENCLGVYNSNRPWLKADLDTVIDADFEGYSLKIMQGFDNYLTTVYGDYMKLPPDEKRIPHHSMEAFWK